MAALPCWLIMPPDFGWCNLHIIHHRAIGQALRQVCEALRQQPALQHVLVGVHSSQRWEEQGKGGWEADIHVQICSDMFDTCLHMSTIIYIHIYHDVYWCSTQITYFTIGYGMAQNTVSSPKKRMGWHDSPGRPALLGLRATAPFRRPRAESAGCFVRWFVCWTSTHFNCSQHSSQQNSFRDWRTWRGEQGTIGDPNQAGCLPNVAVTRGVYPARCCTECTLAIFDHQCGQEAPTNWESLGITWSHQQKLGYIYIYGFIVI